MVTKNQIEDNFFLYAGSTLKDVFKEIVQDDLTPITLEELARARSQTEVPGQEYDAQGSWRSETIHTGTFIQYNFTRDGVTATMVPWQEIPHTNRKVWWQNYHGNVNDGPMAGEELTFTSMPASDRLQLDAQKRLHRVLLGDSYKPVMDSLFDQFPNRRLFGIEMESERALRRYEPIVVPIALEGLNPGRGEFMNAIAKRTGQTPTPYGMRVIAKYR